MKITSKRRAYLKTLAQKLSPMVRIGKDGLSDNLIQSIEDAIKHRELIKVKVLQNSEVEAKELGFEIAKKSGTELIQKIGNTIVLFKENKENPTISSKVKEIG